MFVVQAHPTQYQQRPRLAINPFGLVLEHPLNAFLPELALADPVDLARARYMHALNEQRAAREAYAVHHLRAFHDEAAAYLRQQQQIQAAREEARQQALRARRLQFIQARRQEELSRRRLERDEHELAQALLLALELSSGVQTPASVERVPARAPCSCVHAAATPRPQLAHVPAPRLVPHASSVLVVAPPPRPTPVPQPRVRFSSTPPQAASLALGPLPSQQTTTAIPPKSALKPTASSAPSAASVRISIRESKGKASSHICVNAASASAQPLLAPADAIAALMLLEADLDALTPATTTAPLLKHQLNAILECVDAIESGGHDAVREVRRALVRRIEEALVALEQGEQSNVRPQRTAFITINEPASTRVEVEVPSAADASHSVAVPVTTHARADPEPYVSQAATVPVDAEAASTLATAPEGYVVDDFPMPDVPGDGELVVLQHSAEPVPAQPVEDGLITDGEGSTIDDTAAPNTESDASAVAQELAYQAASELDGPTLTAAAATADPASIPGALVDERPSATFSVDNPVTSPAEGLAADKSTAVGDLAAPSIMLEEATATSTVATASSCMPLPAPPMERPLAASYPPAQTFAAPTHPPVDAGSDGEWERASGSEGEKSDYEVL
ncbi:hypothetical protein AURDEDRAFT_166961 [Auricularia subglabra TFB-10046 SS5]|nr:hypothetical protein AURDEDRAFT_166961 [Auricularia subglabra TFB-10046 SS5]